MREKKSISRRRFVAGASGLMLAGTVANAAEGTGPPATSKLAIDGGEKTVKTQCTSTLRWGEPERKQLDEMLKHSNGVRRVPVIVEEGKVLIGFGGS